MVFRNLSESLVFLLKIVSLFHKNLTSLELNNSHWQFQDICDVIFETFANKKKQFHQNVVKNSVTVFSYQNL